MSDLSVSGPSDNTARVERSPPPPPPPRVEPTTTQVADRGVDTDRDPGESGARFLGAQPTRNTDPPLPGGDVAPTAQVRPTEQAPSRSFTDEALRSPDPNQRRGFLEAAAARAGVEIPPEGSPLGTAPQEKIDRRAAEIATALNQNAVHGLPPSAPGVPNSALTDAERRGLADPNTRARTAGEIGERIARREAVSAAVGGPQNLARLEQAWNQQTPDQRQETRADGERRGQELSETKATAANLALTAAGLPGLFRAGAGLAARGLAALRGVLGRGAVQGLESVAANAAFSNLRGGGGHAVRHLQEAGLIPNSGNLASRVEQARRIGEPILQNPTHRFPWRHGGPGGTPGEMFIGTHNGRQIAIHVASEGPHAGRVTSMYPVDARNLEQWRHLMR